MSKPRNVFYSQSSPFPPSGQIPVDENFYFGYPAAALPFKLDVLEADTASLGLQVTITWKATCGYEGEDHTSLKDPRFQSAWYMDDILRLSFWGRD